MKKPTNPIEFNCTHRLYHVSVKPILNDKGEELGVDYQYPIVEDFPIKSSSISDDGSKMIINGGGRPSAKEVILPVSYEDKEIAALDYFIESDIATLKAVEIAENFSATVAEKQAEYAKKAKEAEEAFMFLQELKDRSIEGHKENKKFHDKNIKK